MRLALALALLFRLGRRPPTRPSSPSPGRARSTQVDTPLASAIGVGDPGSGTFQIECSTTAPDGAPSPTFGDYPPGTDEHEPSRSAAPPRRAPACWAGLSVFERLSFDGLELGYSGRGLARRVARPRGRVRGPEPRGRRRPTTFASDATRPVASYSPTSRSGSFASCFMGESGVAGRRILANVEVDHDHGAGARRARAAGPRRRCCGPALRRRKFGVVDTPLPRPVLGRACLPAPRELTLRALALGCLLGIAFAASSVYLGLKVRLTVSASIPIAVLSITLFRALGRAGVHENNIVQTAGSAGESIAAGVAFTVPSLLLMGFGLELLKTTLIALLGGAARRADDGAAAPRPDRARARHAAVSGGHHLRAGAARR